METRAELIGRWVLRIAGLAGLAIFTLFFSLTYRTPEWVESFGRDFIEQRTWNRVDSGIDAIEPPKGESRLEKLAAGVYERHSASIEGLKAQLKDRSRDLFLVALDQVRDLDCECRQRIETAWRDMNLAMLAQLVTDNQRVIAILQNGYMEVVHELRREIRIFTATNAAAFLFLLLVSFAKPGASRHLLFPGMLLLSATLLCAFLYLFSQDWLLTLLHGSYVGWAYAVYLAMVFLFLCDIAFNRGRVTTRLLNGLSSSLGGIFSSLTPC